MAELLEKLTWSCSKFVSELIHSPINIALFGVCGLLVYKVFFKRQYEPAEAQRRPELPKMKPRDFTLKQLREFDGTKEPDKRLLLAINGKVFDVTKGRNFYGQGGPYASLAGRDATRALATFAIGDVKDDHDDLSDLNSMQMESVGEWVLQFSERYDYVGRLLKPGEEPTEYSDDEDASQVDSKSDDVNEAKKDI